MESPFEMVLQACANHEVDYRYVVTTNGVNVGACYDLVVCFVMCEVLNQALGREHAYRGGEL